MIPRPAPRPKKDATIALINIVFLMLIFFLIAGTLAAPLDPDLQLVETGDLEGREPPDALVLKADGSLTYRGEPVTAEAHIAGLEDLSAIRIVPDRAAAAETLVSVAATLRDAGAGKVIVVTERALQ
ncbi:ExbD/TolR family protein [Algicella marina]|uniref:Biopolymer transporter ExbD n=1 Tax=Algicella marina TaxID=2683284 RepID=A0A6P1T122_9RHOB|nr:biopolymer transporter ExbD [Algicella marina]QHQ35146.1 biopolymer transporter ExbD [Algicella marina]